MGVVGSYLRFGLGIIICLETVRIAVFNEPISSLAVMLALVYLASSAMYFARKMMGG